MTGQSVAAAPREQALRRARLLGLQMLPLRRAHFAGQLSDNVTMDHLWTPWRYAYVTGGDSPRRAGVPAELSAWEGDKGCVFCNLIASIDFAIQQGMEQSKAEAAGGLVYRGTHCFVCLNAYPYTSGHVMAMPCAHLDRLAALPQDTAQELMDLARMTELVLEKVYQPHGYNFGLNIGKAGGAGVAGHLHLHAMPRWLGDTNFMTTVGETRVLPEALEETWLRLREAFAEIDAKNKSTK